ncbi:hypothetical protein Bca101_057648 [Brassica carinata]
MELEQLPSGWQAMDKLLKEVRIVTFSGEAMNQPIACGLVPASDKGGAEQGKEQLSMAVRRRLALEAAVIGLVEMRERLVQETVKRSNKDTWKQ